MVMLGEAPAWLGNAVFSDSAVGGIVPWVGSERSNALVPMYLAR